MNLWEEILKVSGKRYYGDLLMGVFELFAIIIGLVYARKDKMGRLFIGYLTFDFLVLIGGYYIKLGSSFSFSFLYYFIYFSNDLVSLVELFVYYHFFFHIIQNKSFGKLMHICKTCFAVIVIVFAITKFEFLSKRYSYISYSIGAIEFLLLIPPCFVYYFEVIKNKSVINLFERPSFWVVTGIFFYSLISVPFYLLSIFVESSNYEHSNLIELFLFYAPFIVNFIFLSKSFLCEKLLII